jgi:hypothetical protein
MQALEEIRRRDPVKRAILIGAAIVAVVLVWITSLMVERIGVKSEISGLESKIQNGSKDYKQVLDNQQSLVDGKQKLVSLRQLSTNRFLIGDALDAFQKSTVDNVQLTRLKIDQSYQVTEASKPTTNAETGAVSPARPASAVERIVVTLNAKDSSSVPGDSIGHFQAALSRNAFFHPLFVNRTNDFRLTTSLTPQVDVDGRTFVAFTLESHLPDKSR